jgi:hypothetical protein
MFLSKAAKKTTPLANMAPSDNWYSAAPEHYIFELTNLPALTSRLPHLN